MGIAGVLLPITKALIPLVILVLQLCSDEESLALRQFNQTLTADGFAALVCSDYGFHRTLSWKEGTDCCSWDGVTCDAGHVIGLDLRCSQLYGTIDSNSSLFLLHHLQSLNLALNDFKDSQISSEFGRLSNLTYLNLSRSSFSGYIPSEMSHLSKLVSLDLSGNSLELVQPRPFQNLSQIQELRLDFANTSALLVPDFLMNLSSSLTSLSFRSCQLVGDFPDYVLNLPNLKMLNLQYNGQLTGYVRNVNWSSSSPLEYLDLSHTSFSGSLPESLGILTQVKYLDVSSCKFSGQIPSTLSNLEQLNYLDVSFNDLDGQIPNFFANHTKLVYLDFSFNHLTGSFSSNFSGLPSLINLDLSFNSLSGTIPSWLFTLPSLLVLDLSFNRFTGQIHEFQSRSLKKMYLESNKFDGPIPLSLFLLVNLTHLSLSSNNFSGVMDLNLFSNLQKLIYVDLSRNSHISLISTNNSINFTLPKFQVLQLSSCNVGEFPDFIRALEYLVELDLSDNKIHGEIPKWLLDVGKVSLSYLNLSHNFLTADLEKLPWNWSSLGFLDLHSNLFVGQLQFPISNMVYISIAHNKATGQIPSSVCNLSFLGFLDLSNNNMTGEIPQCLGSFSENLEVLNLRSNSFHGSLPQIFESGTKLRSLDVNNNRLHGQLPRSLANCPKLEVLDLGNNIIDDTFPFWLETLPVLKVLVLRSNRFHGPIGRPGTSSAFTDLNIIDLSFNEFTGNLPSEYFKSWNSMMVVDEDMPQSMYMSTSIYADVYYFDSVTIRSKGLDMELVRILTIFKVVDCSNNKFVGEIPDSIGNLKAIHVLNLSGNGLTGHIPSSLANLRQIESMDLSKNKLSGKIPEQLPSLEFLAVFDVSHNQLTGSIPRGKQFETFSITSYAGNTGLCGFPLSTTCGNVVVEQPPSSPSQQGNDSELMDGFSWKSVLMGYGCGTVFGILVGHCILRRKEELIMKIFAVGMHRPKRRLKKVRQQTGRRS